MNAKEKTVLDLIREDLQSVNNKIDGVTNQVQHLSLGMYGDEQNKIPGMIDNVKELKQAQEQDEIWKQNWEQKMKPTIDVSKDIPNVINAYKMMTNPKNILIGLGVIIGAGLIIRGRWDLIIGFFEKIMG